VLVQVIPEDKGTGSHDMAALKAALEQHAPASSCASPCSDSPNPPSGHLSSVAFRSPCQSTVHAVPSTSDLAPPHTQSLSGISVTSSDRFDYAEVYTTAISAMDLSAQLHAADGDDQATSSVTLSPPTPAATSYTPPTMILGLFSAGCPVTGTSADCAALTKLLHEHCALAAIDFSCAGTECGADLSGGGMGADVPDAVVLAPYRLPGGPGAAGLLLVRRSAVQQASTGARRRTLSISSARAECVSS
jgi:hypothetical protein